ncbi:hypothetical protein Rsub_07716 [Raphidocelis subcapitata]|uniref:SOUL heme-binding protein n=1 Tax=Raphidocelis subcapitata TaxID=307507 RepID=A0A2V0P863_9CHLO|nr:hypothetical protein Rsub_07716 [Raphidocelis subcapitata]|eukprot:GBF95132.1 hypothetical protein Rsub_07716 [Raphidocelis subcapitata]
MEDAASFLRGELRGLFAPGGEVTRARYSPSLHFEDPITRLDNLEAYVLMVRALKTVFNIGFELHTLEVSGPDEITARWTMTVEVWPLPWRPTAVFTGRSKYVVDASSGLITSHRDTWDAVADNSFPSLEALAVLMRQALDLTQIPKDLETPKYSVVRAGRGYEVRRMEGFLVADAPMAAGAGPASGSGFNTLAGYIFGGNKEKESISMTTPVFSEVTESGPQMSFVMESKYSDVSSLPAPLDPRVKARAVAPKFVAAARFSGLAFDWEVDSAERALRAALLRDGIAPAMGYRLARYNDPTVLPPFRRNEVLIDLPDFEWP